MNTKLLHSPHDPWYWRLADLRDVVDIVDMADQEFRSEVSEIFHIDRARYEKEVAQALIEQAYNPLAVQLVVARDRDSDVLMAYAWLGRGVHLPYSTDEIAEARFLHLRLNLNLRYRVRLTAQVLNNWHLWCQNAGIPVLISSSIRENQAGFMRLHENMGFVVRGSIAYLKIGE
jgi:hypothetical protein